MCRSAVFCACTEANGQPCVCVITLNMSQALVGSWLISGTAHSKLCVNQQDLNFDLGS